MNLQHGLESGEPYSSCHTQQWKWNSESFRTPTVLETLHVNQEHTSTLENLTRPLKWCHHQGRESERFRPTRVQGQPLRLAGGAGSSSPQRDIWKGQSSPERGVQEGGGRTRTQGTHGSTECEEGEAVDQHLARGRDEQAQAEPWAAAQPEAQTQFPIGRPSRMACQVEGCSANLTEAAKEYHRRHKVCEMHSKAATVVLGAQVQRFCQQCSRFHPIAEFDEGKRSCRLRLLGHNRRRRKSLALQEVTGGEGSEGGGFEDGEQASKRSRVSGLQLETHELSKTLGYFQGGRPSLLAAPQQVGRRQGSSVQQTPPGLPQGQERGVLDLEHRNPTTCLLLQEISASGQGLPAGRLSGQQGLLEDIAAQGPLTQILSPSARQQQETLQQMRMLLQRGQEQQQERQLLGLGGHSQLTLHDILPQAVSQLGGSRHAVQEAGDASLAGGQAFPNVSPRQPSQRQEPNTYLGGFTGPDALLACITAEQGAALLAPRMGVSPTLLEGRQLGEPTLQHQRATGQRPAMATTGASADWSGGSARAPGLLEMLAHHRGRQGEVPRAKELQQQHGPASAETSSWQDVLQQLQHLQQRAQSGSQDQGCMKHPREGNALKQRSRKCTPVSRRGEDEAARPRKDKTDGQKRSQ